MDILRQLGELLLGSVPTIILFIVFYGMYLFLVHRPLARVLAQRYALTQGAIEKARADVASAEARTVEYERKLRDARVAVFKVLESRRAQAAQARAEAVAQARSNAQAQVEQAREEIAKQGQAARNSLQGDAQQLAREIIRSVLEPATMQAGGK